MRGETTSSDDKQFLGEILAALGWDQSLAIEETTAENVLAEVRRLRRGAGEGGAGESASPIIDIEHLTVARVNRVGGERSRTISLWLTTRAGTVETYTQVRDRPGKRSFVEQPERNLLLMMDVDHAREVHGILAAELGGSGSGEGP